MRFGWPTATIGSIATPIERAETPVPGKAYRQIGVRWWGEGVYERETIDGSNTQYAVMNRLEADDIVINKIWARHGSVSVVQPELEGCYCSTEFPIFRPDFEQLEPRWFFWMTRTKWFWSRCDAKSRSTSGKNRIRPDQFLQIEIPLPPLAEQQRIVAKIERLAGKIEEARGLRRESTEQASQITHKSVSDLLLTLKAETVPLGALLREGSRNGLAATLKDAPPGIPVLRISAGTSRLDGIVDEGDFKYAEPTEKQLEDFQLLPGDLLACRFNGNLHFVGRFSLYTGYTGETRLYPDKLIRFRVNPVKVVPEYVRLVMNSEYGRKLVEQFCKTTTGNIGINNKNLNSIPIPVLALSEQHRIVGYLDGLLGKIEQVKAVQSSTAAELDALLPAILDRAFKGEL